MNSGELVLHVEYGCFHVAALYDVGEAPGRGPWRLVAPTGGGGAIIRTGIHVGPIRVAWRLGNMDGTNVPAVPALDDWEDIVQVVITPRDGELRLIVLGGDGDISPNYVYEPDAEYMVRVAARGRRTGVDVVDELTEDYLVDIWPRNDEEPWVHKLTSELAKVREGARTR